MSEDRSGTYRSEHRHVYHYHHHMMPGGVVVAKDSRNVKSVDSDPQQRRHLMYYRSDPNMQARVHSEPLPGDVGGDPHARGRSKDGRPRTSAKKPSDTNSNFDSGVSLMYDRSNDPSNEK